MEFDKLARLFLPITVRGVLEAKQSSHDRLVEKLEELQFITRSIISNPTNKTIELQILDEELLHLLLSGEANKFWLGCMLSLGRSHQAQNKNFAWQAVEHYYAAYYAVHYLIRISGVGLSNLSPDGATAIL